MLQGVTNGVRLVVDRFNHELPVRLNPFSLHSGDAMAGRGSHRDGWGYDAAKRGGTMSMANDAHI